MTNPKSRAGYHAKPIYGGDALADLAWDQVRYRNDAAACDNLLAALIKYHGQPPPDVRVTRATAWRTGLDPDRRSALKSNLGWAGD